MEKIKSQINNLPLPNFLAFDFAENDFEFSKTSSSKNYQNYLIENFKQENTIIILNGEVIFNSCGNIEIKNLLNTPFLNEYKLSQSKNKLEEINKQNLKSAIGIEINDAINLNLIVAGSFDLAQFLQVEIKNNLNSKIFEKVLSFDNAKINYFSNYIVNKNSNLEYFSFQKTNGNYDVFCQNAKVFEKANFDQTLLNLSDFNTINKINIELLEKDAKAKIESLSFANKNQKLVNLFEIRHKATSTQSEIDNVGFANNDAKLVVDGINAIEKGNAKSIANQTTRIINLSNKAKSVANPQLIIDEFDVKAGHSATVGQIDEDVVYYLQSRGLTKKEAIKLLIDSYSHNVISKLEGHLFEKDLENYIKEKIS